MRVIDTVLLVLFLVSVHSEEEQGQMDVNYGKFTFSWLGGFC